MLRWLKDDYSGTLRSGHLGTSCIRTVMIIEVSSFQGVKDTYCGKAWRITWLQWHAYMYYACVHIRGCLQFRDLD